VSGPLVLCVHLTVAGTNELTCPQILGTLAH